MGRNTIEAVLRVRDDGTLVMERFQNVASEGMKQVGESADKAGISIDKVGQSATNAGIAFTAFGAAGAAALTASVKSLNDFELQLASVNTVLAADAGVGIETLRAQILGLGSELGSATELTGALYQAISASVEPAAAVAFVGEAALLAKAGLTDAFTAVDVLTTATNAFAKQNLTASAAADSLFLAVREGKTTLGELAQSIGTVIPTAANLGLSFNDLNATLAELTKVGLSTPIAVTSLGAALTQLNSPSEKAKELINDLGLDLNKMRDQLKTTGGLIDVLSDLTKATDGNSEAIATFFGNVRAQRAVFTLLNQDVDGVKQALVDFTAEQEAGGIAAAGAAKIMETTAEKISALKNEFEKAQIGLTQGFNVALDDTIGSLREGLKAFNDLSDGQKEVFGETALGATKFALLSGALLLLGGRSVKVAQGFVALAKAETIAGIATTALTTKASILASAAGLGALIVAAGATVVWLKKLEVETQGLTDRIDEFRKKINELPGAMKSTTIVTNSLILETSNLRAEIAALEKKQQDMIGTNREGTISFKVIAGSIAEKKLELERTQKSLDRYQKKTVEVGKDVGFHRVNEEELAVALGLSGGAFDKLSKAIGTTKEEFSLALKATIKAEDKQLAFAESLGITVKELKAITETAPAAGGAVDKLTKRTEEAQKAFDKLSKEFQKLQDQDLRDAIGAGDLDEAFEATVAAIQDVSDAFETATKGDAVEWANDIEGANLSVQVAFGNTEKKIEGFINDFVKKIGDEAKLAGESVNEGMSFEESEENFESMRKQFASTFTNLIGLLDEFGIVGSQRQKLVAQASESMGKALDKAAGQAMELGKEGKKAFEDLEKAAAAAGKKIDKGLSDSLASIAVGRETTDGLIESLTDSLVDGVEGILQERFENSINKMFETTFKNVSRPIDTLIGNLFDPFAKAFDRMLGKLTSPITDRLDKILRDATDPLGDALDSALRNVDTAPAVEELTLDLGDELSDGMAEAGKKSGEEAGPGMMAGLTSSLGFVGAVVGAGVMMKQLADDIFGGPSFAEATNAAVRKTVQSAFEDQETFDVIDNVARQFGFQFSQRLIDTISEFDVGLNLADVIQFREGIEITDVGNLGFKIDFSPEDLAAELGIEVETAKNILNRNLTGASLIDLSKLIFADVDPETLGLSTITDEMAAQIARGAEAAGIQLATMEEVFGKDRLTTVAQLGTGLIGLAEAFGLTAEEAATFTDKVSVGLGGVEAGFLDQLMGIEGALKDSGIFDTVQDDLANTLMDVFNVPIQIGDDGSFFDSITSAFAASGLEAESFAAVLIGALRDVEVKGGGSAEEFLDKLDPSLIDGLQAMQEELIGTAETIPNLKAAAEDTAAATLEAFTTMGTDSPERVELMNERIRDSFGEFADFIRDEGFPTEAPVEFLDSMLALLPVADQLDDSTRDLLKDFIAELEIASGTSLPQFAAQFPEVGGALLGLLDPISEVQSAFDELFPQVSRDIDEVIADFARFGDNELFSGQLNDQVQDSFSQMFNAMSEDGNFATEELLGFFDRLNKVQREVGDGLSEGTQDQFAEMVRAISIATNQTEQEIRAVLTKARGELATTGEIITRVGEDTTGLTTELENAGGAFAGLADPGGQNTFVTTLETGATSAKLLDESVTGISDAVIGFLPGLADLVAGFTDTTPAAEEAGKTMEAAFLASGLIADAFATTLDKTEAALFASGVEADKAAEKIEQGLSDATKEADALVAIAAALAGDFDTSAISANAITTSFGLMNEEVTTFLPGLNDLIFGLNDTVPAAEGAGETMRDEFVESGLEAEAFTATVGELAAELFGIDKQFQTDIRIEVDRGGLDQLLLDMRELLSLGATVTGPPSGDGFGDGSVPPPPADLGIPVAANISPALTMAPSSNSQGLADAVTSTLTQGGDVVLAQIPRSTLTAFKDMLVIDGISEAFANGSLVIDGSEVVRGTL